METKKGADALEYFLSSNGFPAIAIHGDKVQMVRSSLALVLISLHILLAKHIYLFCFISCRLQFVSEVGVIDSFCVPKLPYFVLAFQNYFLN